MDFKGTKNFQHASQETYTYVPFSAEKMFILRQIMNEQITNWEIKSEEKHADGNACNFFVTSILVTTCKVIYKQLQEQ